MSTVYWNWSRQMGSVQIEQKSYEMPPREGISIAHFLTVADIERSARYYEKVFGARILSLGDGNAPAYLQLANIWMILNVGGGPTPDKPTVTLSVPDPNHINSFLNFRVADIQACYELWKSRGADFITEPIPSTARRAATSAILTVISSRSDRALTSNTVDARSGWSVLIVRASGSFAFHQSIIRFPHPSRNIARAVKHAPNIDAILRFEIEHDMRKSEAMSAVLAGSVQWNIVTNSCLGPANVSVGSLEGVDEAKRDPIARLAQVVRNCFVDIAVGQLTRDNRLCNHRRWLVGRPARTRLRSLLK